MYEMFLCAFGSYFRVPVSGLRTKNKNFLKLVFSALVSPRLQLFFNMITRA